jgi:hypothetical protein
MARLSLNVDDGVKEILEEFAERFVERGQRKPVGMVLDYLIWTLYSDDGFWDELETDIKKAEAEIRESRRKRDRDRQRLKRKRSP